MDLNTNPCARWADRLAVGVFEVDADGIATFVNESLAQLSGYPREALLGRGWQVLIHPRERKRVERCLRRLRERAAVPPGRVRLLTPDGGERAVLCELRRFGPGGYLGTVTPAPSPDGAPCSCGGARKAEAERRRGDDLEHVLFAFAHDLRAPLRAIDFIGVLLQEEAAPGAPARDHAERIRGHVRQLGDLFERLLQLARTGEAGGAVAALDLSALAREVADEVARQEGYRKTRIEIEEGVRGRGDPVLLRQVLHNLFANAFKYCAAAAQPQVRFGRRREGGREVLFVADNGIGFSPEQARRLFQPFARLANAAGYPGTGLGLTSVRYAVERLGGEVWAESREGEGATFCFTLEPDRR